MSKESRISVNTRILELLGPNLYTNIYYILAELIANAYDADAHNVYLIEDRDNGDIIVEDDGRGMSYENGDIEKLPVAILEPLASALETNEAYLIGLVDDPRPLGSSIGMAADKKKAALQQEDGKVAEIMELFVNLPADKQQEALSYLRYLSASADK